MDYQNGTQFQAPPGPPHPYPLQQNHYSSSKPHATHPQPSPSPLHAQHPHYQDPRFAQGPPNQHLNFSNGGAMIQQPQPHPQPQAPTQTHTQAQSRGQPNYYSQGSPYSQSIPTPPVQKLAHTTHASSPQNLSNSPYSAPTTLQTDISHTSPMSAPVSQPPSAQFGQGGVPAQPRSVPQSPLTAEIQARDRERVTLLLEINSELLQEASNLQSQGKGGTHDSEGKPKAQPHKDYSELLRRLHVNLQFLATSHERFSGKPNAPPPPAGPAIMSAPPSHPALQELYGRLQAVCPGWKGARPDNSPGPQRHGSSNVVPGVGASPTSQTTNDAKPQPTDTFSTS